MTLRKGGVLHDSRRWVNRECPKSYLFLLQTTKNHYYLLMIGLADLSVALWDVIERKRPATSDKFFESIKNAT